MIAVIFEGRAGEDQAERYLDIAAHLRPILDTIPGFLSIERFQSLSEPGKLLSLSFWESEEAVAAWRNTPAHRAAQAEGRAEVFEDYRIRVAEVTRDYRLGDRTEAPADSKMANFPPR